MLANMFPYASVCASKHSLQLVCKSLLPARAMYLQAWASRPGKRCIASGTAQQPVLWQATAAPTRPSHEAGVSSAVDHGYKFIDVDEDASEFDFLGESTEGNLQLLPGSRRPQTLSMLGLKELGDVYSIDLDELKASAQDLLNSIQVPAAHPVATPHRAVYCSRTMNLRSIKAIGYDMDYTLINYDVNAWEGRAYDYGLNGLLQQGLPVEGLKFDPDLVIRGLVIDRERGSLVKVDRFGMVKRAMHGTRMMSWQEIRQQYGREVVNLGNISRWVFLNTLFSVSEAVMYMQLVDRLDQGAFGPSLGTMSYQALYQMVERALFRAHVEGKLKEEIIQAPEKYVRLDPEMPATLLDQRAAGKKLVLITNSDHMYTSKMMAFAYDRFLPEGMSWRDLFDIVVVQARKPEFFNANMSLYEVATQEGLLRPAYSMRTGSVYVGGSAKMVEAGLGVTGDAVLYVGDHIYTDAALAKINLRWRTALIIRELEEEIAALAYCRPNRIELKTMLHKKEVVGDLLNQLRLRNGKAGSNGKGDTLAVDGMLAELLMVMEALDDKIEPMLQRDGSLFNERWGYLSRAGLNDKSQLWRQVEKYADIYTSRVSNFLRYSPYNYFCSPSQSLAHDRNLHHMHLPDRQGFRGFHGFCGVDSLSSTEHMPSTQPPEAHPSTIPNAHHSGHPSASPPPPSSKAKPSHSYWVQDSTTPLPASNGSSHQHDPSSPTSSSKSPPPSTPTPAASRHRGRTPTWAAPSHLRPMSTALSAAWNGSSNGTATGGRAVEGHAAVAGSWEDVTVGIQGLQTTGMGSVKCNLMGSMDPEMEEDL